MKSARHIYLSIGHRAMPLARPITATRVFGTLAHALSVIPFVPPGTREAGSLKTHFGRFLVGELCQVRLGARGALMGTRGGAGPATNTPEGRQSPDDAVVD